MMKVRSVLIVEDDDASMDYITIILKTLGYHQYLAITGEIAYELAKDITLDLALIDIALGEGISGIELLHKLRNLPQFEKTPIFAITGFVGTYVKQEMLELGFTDYLEKPYTSDSLKEMISKNVLRPFAV
ncbi:response regulator [Candidatus Neomarinimicrobiota bacterium]